MPPPKKAPAKSTPKPDPGKDLRRAHEHKGRVEALRPLLGKHVDEIDTLVTLAEHELAASHPKDAADLLRAAEHLSFGYLASSQPDEHNGPKLSQGIEEEFQHKLGKAEEHWEESKVLSGIYQKVRERAQKAFEDGAHRKALELVRAADAIAHVHIHDQKE